MHGKAKNLVIGVLVFVAGAASTVAVANYWPNLIPRWQVQPDWIDVGPTARGFTEMKFEGLDKVEYRTVNIVKPKIEASTTMVDLEAKLQRRQLNSSFVYLAVDYCDSPSAMRGRTTVRCREIGGGSVIIAAEAKERETLMMLAQKRQVAAIYGQMIDEFGGTLIVQVR